MFEETNVFTSFAVPPDDEDLPYSYLPVPTMDFLKQDLNDRIKVVIYTKPNTKSSPFVAQRQGGGYLLYEPAFVILMLFLLHCEADRTGYRFDRLIKENAECVRLD